MAYASPPDEAGYNLDQAVEFAELSSSNCCTGAEALDEEADNWVFYEPEANNFGDF